MSYRFRVFNLSKVKEGPITTQELSDMSAEDLVLVYMQAGWFCSGGTISGEFRLRSPDFWNGNFAAYFLALDEPATPPVQEVP